MVISDYMEARSPITGEMFTSKSGIRRHYRANDAVEVGNETIKPRDNDEADISLPQIEREVAQAFDTLS